MQTPQDLINQKNKITQGSVPAAPTLSDNGQHSAPTVGQPAAATPAVSWTFPSTAVFEDYSPLPNGDYVVTVEKAEMKNTKEDNKPMISLTFKVLDGELTNRQAFVNFVLLTKQNAFNGAAYSRFRDIARTLLDDNSALEGINPMEDSVAVGLVLAEILGKTMNLRKGTNTKGYDFYEPAK